jgi:hypothetical protein
MMELAIAIDYSTQWASRIGFDDEFGQGTQSYVGIAPRCASVLLDPSRRLSHRQT